MAHERLEYRDYGDSEPERDGNVGADVVVVDAVPFVGLVFVGEFLVVVRGAEAYGYRAAVVEVPAEHVVDSGFVARLVVEVPDAAVILRVVAVFPEVAVVEFGHFVEDAIFLRVFGFHGGIVGCGLRACFCGGCLGRGLCGGGDRCFRGFGFGLGRVGGRALCRFCRLRGHGRLDRRRYGLVFCGMYLEEREFLACVGYGEAALALRIAERLRGIGDGACHFFAEEVGLDFYEAVGCGGLGRDFLVERDEFERVVGMQLALARGLGDAAERLASGIGLGDGIGGYYPGFDFEAARTVVAAFGAFHGHRGDGQQAPAAGE